MATKQLWINLPVKDVNKSREFFTKIGFKLNTQYGNSDVSGCFQIGDNNIILMLFAETVFKSFTGHEITNTNQSTEVLFSIDAESKAEVDELAKTVVKAGGKMFSEPKESQGWMYGSGFTDLDGHRWNVLYMDITKMPKG